MSNVICRCHKVTEDEIINSIKEGAKTVEAVGEKTKAGTGCGGCKTKIQELINKNKYTTILNL